MARFPSQIVHHEVLPHGLRTDDLIAIVGALPGAAILESGGSGREERWTILAAPPRAVFEATDSAWSLTATDGEILGRARRDPLRNLEDWISELSIPNKTHSMFQGGLIGFYGYDLAPQIETLPRRSGRDNSIPDIRFGLHDVCATIDHFTGEIDVWGMRFVDGSDADLERRWRSFRDLLNGPVPGPPNRPVLSAPVGETSREDYERSVRTALDYIAAGDIFQVNLSQRFSARGKADPLDLFLRLRRRSPAPFSAFLRWDDKAVISASPELFFDTCVEPSRISTRPIKGTRPRGGSPAEDARLIEQLRTSPKDRAELTMIVDLERNDLGRICEYGSVRVVEAAKVETYAQVHHLVATIEGRLRSKWRRPIDVIRAMFPGGSITGAPKIRAMEIIDELEPNRRNLYTGAIGYYGGAGDCFNIAIRTILMDGDRVSYQVGGGIVADSDPANEYEETLHKGRALFEVLGGEGVE